MSVPVTFDAFMEFENFFNQGGFLAVETKYSESFDPIPQLKQQWQLAQALIARGYLVFMVPALNVRFVSRRKANCYRLRRPSKVSRLSANQICLSPLIVLHPTLGLGVGGIGECAAD